MNINSFYPRRFPDRFLCPLFTALLLLLMAAPVRSQQVGEVNGRQIDAAEYQRRVSEAVESQQQYSYGSEVNQTAIRENIFNQMIDEILFAQAVERLGLGISDEQLQQMLLNNPPEYLKHQFTDTSDHFDEALYRRFMADPRAVLAEYGNGPEEIDRIMEQFKQMQMDYRKEQLQEALERAVTASSAPTPATAYKAFKDQESHASGSVAIFHTGMIDDEQVDVSEDEAKAYFNAHSNDYRQPATREVNYISFPLVPSTRDSSAAMSMLATARTSLNNAPTTEEKDALYQEWSEAHGTGLWYPGDFTSFQEIPVEIQAQLKGAKQESIFGPLWLSDGAHLVEVVEIDEKGDPRVRAQHILLEEPEDGNVASVKALAKDIIKRAKAGESFDQLAEYYSNDPASSAQGGDLGYFGRGTMTKEFEDAAFKAKPGSIIGPIKTEFGYHIIKINDRTTRNYKLRDWIITPRVSDVTREEIYRSAQDFRRNLKPGADLVEISNQESLELYTSGPVRRNQPVAGSMKLGMFTFNGTLGSLSDVTRISDGSFAVAQIATIRNAGVMEYDDAKDRVMDILRDGKKLDLLRDRAAAFRAAVVPGVSLKEQNAIDPSATVDSFDELSPRSVLDATGSDTAVVEAIFSQKVGQISEPVRGKEAYYIFLIDSLTVPTEQEFNQRREEFTKQLSLERSRPAFDEWMVTEREKAEIKDLRSE